MRVGRTTEITEVHREFFRNSVNLRVLCGENLDIFTSRQYLAHASG